MLPSLRPQSWCCVVADSNPDAKSFRFEACWNGVTVVGTAVARRDQIELFPIPGLCLEIPVGAFADLASKLLVAAHTRRPSDPA